MGRSILAVGRKNSAHGRESVLNHWGDVHKWCLLAGQIWNDPGRPAGAASPPPSAADAYSGRTLQCTVWGHCHATVGTVLAAIRQGRPNRVHGWFVLAHLKM